MSAKSTSPCNRDGMPCGYILPWGYQLLAQYWQGSSLAGMNTGAVPRKGCTRERCFPSGVICLHSPEQ